MVYFLLPVLQESHLTPPPTIKIASKTFSDNFIFWTMAWLGARPHAFFLLFLPPNIFLTPERGGPDPLDPPWINPWDIISILLIYN